jgi:aerobic carbon-monoxide dehydrogenase small subunit
MEDQQMEETLEFNLNGKAITFTGDIKRKLLWVLRTDLGLTGTKYGCGESFCGACTVLVENEAVRSCQAPVKAVEGKKVLTIEGLSKEGKLHPLQRAFVKHDAMQCGYCTPGMVMNAYAFLKSHPKPSPSDIVQGMEDNFCRCGAHTRIVQAIEEAAQMMEGGF